MTKFLGKGENKDFKAEMRRLIGDAAGDRGPNDTRESMLWRAAQRAGLPFRRVHSHYYGKARTLPVEEYEAMRAAARKTQRAQIVELRARLARLEREARDADEDSHHFEPPETAALVSPLATERSSPTG